MKKKKIVLLSIAATLVCGTIAVIAGNGANYSPIDAEATKNKIVLNKDGALTTTEKEAKKFVRSTDGGNSIEFKIVEGFATTDNDFAKTFDNGRFYNTTPLNGLETIDVACGAKAFRVYYFTSPVDSLEMNYVAFDDCVGVGGSTPISIKVPQFEDPVKYIMWHNKSGANIWLNSIKFNYSCSTSLTNRGSTFDSSGKGVDITPVDVATGTVNVDVKWSDLGSEKGKISIALFQAGWGAGFGYKNIYQTSKTGDIPGLTVLKLSDGYTRFSWKLSEMQGGSPTSIAVVHIHGNNWTTSSGYFDCQSNVKVIEIYGERFVEGTNLSFNYSEVTLAGKQFELDVRFDNDMGKDNNINFYICDSSGCSKCFGNYTFTYKGLNDSYNGVTFTKLSNGYCRVAFDIDSLTKTAGSGAPTTSIYSYIRGNWSHANGYAFLTIK